MWCRVRKWVQQRNTLIPVRFLILSCSPTFRICSRMVPSLSDAAAANSAAQAWMWASLFECDRIFSTTFFPVCEWFGDPVLYSDFPHFLRILQKAPCWSSSYSSKKTLLPLVCCNFACLTGDDACHDIWLKWCTFYFFLLWGRGEGRLGSRCSTSEVSDSSSRLSFDLEGPAPK